MNAGVRLALFGAGLVATFGIAYVVADALVPASVAESWQQDKQGTDPAEEQHP